MKLTMKRKGQFRCNWESPDGKCGIGSDLNPAYQYLCQIETSDEVLDKNGFIIDQLEVDKYFQGRYAEAVGAKWEWQRHPAQSCEKIAINAVKDVKRMLENHMLGTVGMSVVYRIAVTISFGEDAQMTAEWVPDKAKPIANVKRVKQPSLNKLAKAGLADWNPRW